MATVVREKLVVLDPTQEPETAVVTMAPPIADLAGKRIGLLDNSKNGSAQFLDFLAQLLAEQYDGVTFVRARKPNASRPVPGETLEMLARECDLVITAVGD